MKGIVENILLFLLVVRVELARAIAPAGYEVYDVANVAVQHAAAMRLIETLDTTRQNRLRSQGGVPGKQPLRASAARRIGFYAALLAEHASILRANPTSYRRYKDARNSA